MYRSDARGVLTAVLQHRQSVINSCVHRPLAEESNDTAHRGPQIRETYIHAGARNNNLQPKAVESDTKP